jgi:hypothetical protein
MMIKNILFLVAISHSVFISAQVQVRDEPRHHNVFENEYLRVLDVFLAPNDTTQYHLHNTPSVFIILANCMVISQLLGGQPQAGANVAGIISYDAMKTERIHRVWNIDTTWFHVLDIELTSPKQKGKTNVLQEPFLKLLFDKEQANGYRITLQPGNTINLPASANGYLLVSLTRSSLDIQIQGAAQHRIVRDGHYEWIEEGKAFTLKITGQTPGNFVLLQLK